MFSLHRSHVSVSTRSHILSSFLAYIILFSTILFRKRHFQHKLTWHYIRRIVNILNCHSKPLIIILLLENRPNIEMDFQKKSKANPWLLHLKKDWLRLCTVVIGIRNSRIPDFLSPVFIRLTPVWMPNDWWSNAICSSFQIPTVFCFILLCARFKLFLIN